jgi:hypothetical protein
MRSISCGVNVKYQIVKSNERVVDENKIRLKRRHLLD